MALAIWPARHGQQRSRVKIFQALSWAFALSPGARSFAWARLACFWDSGFPLPRYGTVACAAPWYPLPARVTRPAAASSGSMSQIQAAFLSWTEPGSVQCQELKGLG